MFLCQTADKAVALKLSSSQLQGIFKVFKQPTPSLGKGINANHSLLADN